MAYDAREIANFILDEADNSGTEISNLKLLKLLFFAHGSYMAEFDRELIDEEFQAWKHGPVVQSVYYAFKDSGARAIRERATAINLQSGERELIRPQVDEETKSFLKIIVQQYVKFEAFELSRMTHEAGTPWDRVWNGFENRARTGMLISNNEITQFFREQFAREIRH